MKDLDTIVNEQLALLDTQLDQIKKNLRSLDEAKRNLIELLADTQMVRDDMADRFERMQQQQLVLEQ